MISVKRLNQEPRVRRYWTENSLKRKTLDFPSECIVPSTSGNPSLVATAVDLAIKLYYSSNDIQSLSLLDYLRDTFPRIGLNFSSFHELEHLTQFLELSKTPDLDCLAKASSMLALVEVFNKAGYVDHSELLLGMDLIVPEVRQIISLFTSFSNLEKDLIINPIFSNNINIHGEGDLIIGDTLWDIKTTAQKGVKKDDYNQLLTYFILAKTTKEYSHLTKFGFFYTRQNFEIDFNPKDVFTNTDYKEIANDLKKIAEETYQ